MKQTGQILKDLREEKSISIEEVVLATKIKASTIRAIESGDLKQLPSKTFIRGFVQSYARFLKADEDAILESFLSEMGSTIDIPKQSDDDFAVSESSTAVQFANSNRHPLFKVIVIVCTLILIGGIYIISKTIDKYQQEKQLVESTQKEAQTIEPLEIIESTETKLDDTENPVPNEKLEAETEEAILDEPIVPETKTNIESIKEKPVESPPAPKPELEIQKPILPEAKKLEPKKEAASPSPKVPVVEVKKVDPPKVEKPAETKPIEPKKTAIATFIPQEIIIEALDSVSVDFKTDESSWVKINLKPEQIHTIKARNEIRVKLSDGGAVNIIHNGKDRGVPGTLGAKTEIKFP